MTEQSYLQQLIQVSNEDNYAQNVRLNKRQHQNLRYESDGMSATYLVTNQGVVEDAVFVQTDQQIPEDISLFYYEVLLKRKAANRSIVSIGIADENFPMNKLVGLTRTSYGYRSDGKTCQRKQEFDLKLQPYKEGDIVGCGLNLLKRELFFTYNGIKSLSISDITITTNVYPTVSMQGDVQIQFNFGKTDFKFDRSKIFKLERQQIYDQIIGQNEQPYSLHLIIQEYLWSQGYLDTLKLFEQESQLQTGDLKESKLKQNIPQQQQHSEEMVYDEEENVMQFDSDEKKRKKIKQQNDNLQLTPMTPLQRKLSGLQSPNFSQIVMEKNVSGFQLDDYNNENLEINQIAEQAFMKNSLVNEERQRIKQLIQSGDIPQVIQKLRECIPDYYQIPQVFATLHSQWFIELIRLKNINEAISYGQTHLSNCLQEKIEVTDEHGGEVELKVECVLGLICYDDVESSKLKGLISQQQREVVSDFINRTLLVHLGYEDESALEICLKQLIQVCQKAGEFGLLAGQHFTFQT